MEMIYAFDRLRLSAPNGLRSRLTIVADLTIALWRGGECEAAVALERIWNDLTRTFPVSTCASSRLTASSAQKPAFTFRHSVTRTAQSL